MKDVLKVSLAVFAVSVLIQISVWLVQFGRSFSFYTSESTPVFVCSIAAVITAICLVPALLVKRFKNLTWFYLAGVLLAVLITLPIALIIGRLAMI